MLFVMLNPSTADATIDDPTIRRCMRFARDHAFDAIEVVNLFATRATDPKDLKAAGYPVGPENDGHIADALKTAAGVCLAWGDQARGLARPAEVVQLVQASGHSPMCLALTSRGLPRHPLMLAAEARLQPFVSTARA